MKKIIILGSTGSIGTNALKVIENNDNFEVVGMSAHKNHDLLIEQIKKFNPKYISIGTHFGADKIKKLFPKLHIYIGEEGLKKLASIKEYDILLTAVSGAVGIESTIIGIENNKRIALANKETMVAAGEFINKKYPSANIIPVDSEHSAIFQALMGNNKKDIQNIIITASGGTFRGKTIEELRDVSVSQALNHPNWKMGKKITIDSSTLVNKGLEVIEAHELFGVDYDKIKVVVHPQSIIHSMVEYNDNSIIAQMGAPDMKIPIQFAFTYPNREKNISLPKLDLLKMGDLTFCEPDHETFKGIKLAYTAGKIGGSMPCVLNAANEMAVELFLENKIKFLEIYEIIEGAMEAFPRIEIESISVIKDIDKKVREWVYKNYDK